MFHYRRGRREPSSPLRAESVVAGDFDPGCSSSHPALVCALVLINLALAAQPVQAQTREHILLARQVGLPENQAVAVLISNRSHKPPGRPCNFNGALRTEEITPPFGSGLDELVFEPISLAPGESVAIDIQPPDVRAPGAQVHPSQIKVLIMAVEADDAVSSACPLLVQALGYDASSGATEVLIDRYILGVEKTFAISGDARSPVPLGFVGGNADQTARLVLISENTSGLPADHCERSGEVIAQIVPRLHDDSDDQARSIEKSWPIKWQGPAIKSVAIIDIPFADLDPPADQRVDSWLSLRFDDPLPAACFKRLNSSLQVFDQSTGATRAVIPRDRVLFNYDHFHN